jgi:hypothetical protein
MADFPNFYTVDSTSDSIRNNINLIFRVFHAIPPSPRRPFFSPITDANPISFLSSRSFNINSGRIKIDRIDPLRYSNNLINPFTFSDDEKLEINNNNKLLEVNEIIK